MHAQCTEPAQELAAAFARERQPGCGLRASHSAAAAADRSVTRCWLQTGRFRLALRAQPSTQQTSAGTVVWSAGT